MRGERRFDPEPLLALVPGNDAERAEVMGVTQRTALRWRIGETQMNESTADRTAIRLGLHPCLVWEEWYEHDG